MLLVLKRHYQFWFTILALHKIGAVAIPATNILKVEDYRYRIEAANVKAVVCTADDKIPDAMAEETWASVKDIAKKELSNKKLFVVDAFCGANADTRMAIRFIVEVAWQAHFVTNMFIKPTAEELENFEPDFVVYNASKAKVENYKELGLNSETCVAFNITSHEQVIINTWYGGEMKKGMFSMMNYYLPLKGMAAMHCSANTDMNGKGTAKVLKNKQKT